MSIQYGWQRPDVGDTRTDRGRDTTVALEDTPGREASDKDGRSISVQPSVDTGTSPDVSHVTTPTSGRGPSSDPESEGYPDEGRTQFSLYTSGH